MTQARPERALPSSGTGAARRGVRRGGCTAPAGEAGARGGEGRPGLLTGRVAHGVQQRRRQVGHALAVAQVVVVAGVGEQQLAQLAQVHVALARVEGHASVRRVGGWVWVWAWGGCGGLGWGARVGWVV